MRCSLVFLATMQPYKAAGVLPWCNTAQGPSVLMAFEENRGSWRCKFHAPPLRQCQDGADCAFLHIDAPETSPDERPMNRLNFLGGKREPGDADASVTAAREFHEETHGLVSLAAAHALTRAATMLRTRGHYHLFLGGLAATGTASAPHDLPRHYAAKPRAPPLACALELVWVPVAEFVAPVGWDATLGYHLVVQGQKRPVTNLVWAFLEQHRNAVADIVLSKEYVVTCFRRGYGLTRKNAGKEM